MYASSEHIGIVLGRAWPAVLLFGCLSGSALFTLFSLVPFVILMDLRIMHPIAVLVSFLFVLPVIVPVLASGLLCWWSLF